MTGIDEHKINKQVTTVSVEAEPGLQEQPGQSGVSLHPQPVGFKDIGGPLQAVQTLLGLDAGSWPIREAFGQPASDIRARPVALAARYLSRECGRHHAPKVRYIAPAEPTVHLCVDVNEALSPLARPTGPRHGDSGVWACCGRSSTV